MPIRSDIATFWFEEREVEYLRKHPLRGFNKNWPPLLPEVYSPISFAGFPGSGRRWTASREMSFGLVALHGLVTSVHDKCISILIEREALISLIGGSMPDNFDFGGVSGGPAIGIYQSYTMRGWFPVGVVIEGPNPGNKPEQMSIEGLELIRLRPIHFVDREGYLDLSRWT